MSVEDRLYALVAQAREANGDAFLKTPGQLVPLLSSQAPDLHAEIRALGAALASDTGGRIAAAVDPEAEAGKAAGEIAVSERLSMGVVQAAIAVARKLGALGAAMPATPAGGGWAGDSVVVGGAAAPAYQAPPAYAPQPGAYVPPPLAADGAKPPIWKSKWALGAAGAVALLVAFQMNKPQQPPQPQPQPPPVNGPVDPNNPPVIPNNPPVNPNNPPVNPDNPPVNPNNPPVDPNNPPANNPGGGQAPMLQPPNGQLPALQIQRLQNGTLGIGFTMQVQNGVLQGIVMLPGSGWEGGNTLVGFMRPGGNNQQPDSFGGGMLRLANSQMGPMRSMRPQWQQDNIGFGDICVAFIGRQGGQDVSLQGSTLCIMDSSCSQPSACGVVR